MPEMKTLTVNGVTYDLRDESKAPATQVVTKVGEDINDYQTEGRYYFAGDYLPANAPANVANGWLIVIPGGSNRGKQIWCRLGTIDSNDHQTFVRTWATENGWSEWARYITTKDTAASIGAVAVSNEGEAHIIAGAKTSTRYRLAVTTAGNLRVDVSTDSGATWNTYCYVPKTMNGSAPATPVITSSGRTGQVSMYNGGSATNGAGIWLYGNDHANAGKFRIQVYDETANKYRQFDGSPDGSLKWDGREIGLTETLTLTTATQSNYNVAYVKTYCRAGIVDVYINVTVNTAASAWVTVAKLPSGYCPPNNVYEDIPYFKASANYENLRLRVITTGEIQLSQGTASASYTFHDTFVCA